MMLLWTVLGLVLVALALQHAAYIIQYGSIFNSCRGWAGRPDASWLTRKLNELIHCQLCTITQLALWWVVLPVAWETRAWAGEFPVLWFFSLIYLWFSVSALGLAAWDVTRLIGRGSDALVLYARSLRRES